MSKKQECQSNECLAKIADLQKEMTQLQCKHLYKSFDFDGTYKVMAECIICGKTIEFDDRTCNDINNKLQARINKIAKDIK